MYFFRRPIDILIRTYPLVLYSGNNGTHLCPPYDELEINLWRGRKIDGRRVAATFAGIDELPRVIPVLHLGKLS